MGNLLASLRGSAAAMRVFERGLGVVQNNITNSSTPGFAKQRQVLVAQAADFDRGLTGGVASGGTLDSRSSYLDGTVRQRLEDWGAADEQTNQLGRLEPLFSIKSDSGVMGAINDLSKSISAATVAPNDQAARQGILDSAAALGRSFASMANGLSDAGVSAKAALTDQVKQVNHLASQIAEINARFREDFRAQQDPGLQAQLNNNLEELSKLTGISVLYGDDGAANVYLGGQAPLVLGDKQFQLTADVGGATARVLDGTGKDVSGMIDSGRVRGILTVANTLLPGYQADLNNLAQTIADRVNSVLAAGVDRNGSPPAQQLFAYDAAVGAAWTLTANNLTTDELALALPTAPGGNGNALQMSSLFQTAQVGGVTFSQYYGNLAAKAGSDLAASEENLATRAELSAQASQMREEVTKVSLDEEAITLMEFQRGYQACGQMIKTINEMTETLLGLIR